MLPGHTPYQSVGARSQRFLVAIVVGIAAVGCSSSGGKPTGGDEPIKSDAGSPSPREPDAAPPPKESGVAPTMCHGPGYAGSPTKQQFSHLSATVVDDNGKPVAGVVAQACGTNICLNGTTADNGTVAIDQPVGMTKPAFKYGGGENFVRFALPLTDSAIDVDLGKEITFPFDPPASGVALEPGKAAVSNGITLTVSAATTTITPDPFDFDTDDLKKFRAREVPIDGAPAAVDPSFDFGMVVALTPAATVLCPAAALSVPNSPGWAAGSRVEMFLHGVDVDEEWAPYGGWAKVSEGAVSADAKTIETDQDGGLPALSVVGIRLAK
ncbi:MAG TPA: hypothetical protein VH062_25340 [Polyangiaceae bacterium]|jgi:hypothetical protein|nr:hypothetical protein [Polyangiaceae bacterium]